MIYLILNKDKKVIKQFSDYVKAFAWCLEIKNKQFVQMMCINTNTFKINEVISF